MCTRYSFTMAQVYIDYVIQFLTAAFPFAPEFQNFFMSVQGAMAVRNMRESKSSEMRKMNWFHAFAQGLVTSYAGGLFAPMWMGRPTPMLSNDLCFGFCMIAFVLVNYTPFDMGYKLMKLLPFKMLTVMGAQLFRMMGIVTFVNIAYDAFKDSPSKYYPTPIFGPILNGTILGNMGFFFWKGFHGHLDSAGMPFPFQNGFFVSTVYHFVSHDKGPIGEYLRMILLKLPFVEADNIVIYTICFLSLFMQLNGILQMPEFVGPSFNPFHLVVPNKPKRVVQKSTIKAAETATTVSTKKQSKKKKKA